MHIFEKYVILLFAEWKERNEQCHALHTWPCSSQETGKRVTKQFCKEITSLPITSCAIGQLGGPKAGIVHLKIKPKAMATGEEKLVCSRAQRRICLEHQESSGAGVCHLCPLRGHVLVGVRP